MIAVFHQFKYLLAVAALTLCVGALGSEALIQLDKKSGEVSFTSIGQPSALRIHGKGEGPEGTIKITLPDSTQPAQVSSDITFSLDTLDTGIAMRTHHMKEKYLETERFPKAELIMNAATMPNTLVQGNGSADIPFNGSLKLHGTQNAVSGTATIKRDGEKIHTLSKFSIILSDYGIAIPKFAGITMAKNVDIEVTFDAPVPAVRSKK